MIKKTVGSCSGFITRGDGGDGVIMHCKQLVDTEGELQQSDTVSYDTAKDLKNAVGTEDSCSYMRTGKSCSYAGTKSTIPSSTAKLAQGMCHRVQGREHVNSAEALMTALTQQLVPAVIEANSVSVQLYPRGDMLVSGATRNFGLEFTQSIMALMASISETTKQAVM